MKKILSRVFVVLCGLLLLIIALIVSYVNNNEVAYRIDKIISFNKHIAEPIYKTIESITDNNGYSIYVFNATSGWKRDFIPNWKNCKKINYGYGLNAVSKQFNLTNNFNYFVQFKDSSYFAFFRTEENDKKIIMLWGFPDYGGAIPDVKTYEDVCMNQ